MARRKRRMSSKTKLKRKVAKWTGVPTTRSGRNAKIGRIITGGGCMVQTMCLIGSAVVLVSVIKSIINF